MKFQHKLSEELRHRLVNAIVVTLGAEAYDCPRPVARHESSPGHSMVRIIDNEARVDELVIAVAAALRSELDELGRLRRQSTGPTPVIKSIVQYQVRPEPSLDEPDPTWNSVTPRIWQLYYGKPGWQTRGLIEP